MAASKRHRGASRRRRWPWALAFVGALGVAGAWLGWTAREARSDLVASASSLPAVKNAVLNGDVAAARAQVTVLHDRAHHAYRRTHDPVWSVAAHVPVLGQPLETVRALTETVDGVTSDALVPLSAVAQSARLDTLVRGSSVDVRALLAARAPLEQAKIAIEREQGRLERAPRSWLPPVAQARTDLLQQLAPLNRTVDRAERASRLLPPMLGAEGPRRYFLGFQNPAEARGTGGLLDAYAIVRADQGTISVERIGANTQLPAPKGPLEHVNREFVDRYGVQGATYLWVNTNLSPDFSEVAPVWLEMWRMATGEQLDGAIALDPAALSRVLAATGPVFAPGVGAVDASTVQALVTQKQYLLSEEVARRKSLMVGVGEAAVSALLSAKAQPRGLIDALTTSAEGRHLMLYSRHGDEQADLRTGGVTGEVPDTAGPFAQAVVVNAAGSKLDAYLDQGLDYRVTTCGRQRRSTTITVTLKNAAPTGKLPAYVTTRADDPQPAVPVGQNRVDLQVLLTRGARVLSAALDKQALAVSPPEGGLPAVLPPGPLPDFLGAGTQAGRPSYGLELELPVGQVRVLTLTVEEPPSTVPPVLPVQALVQAPRVTSEVAACRGL